MASDYTVAGVMSGTSLDGLDIAICRFEELSGRWSFDILASHTILYSDLWKNRLASAFTGTGEELAKLHADFGNFIGSSIKAFCILKDIQPDFISSHGHTIFHQPANHFTFQVGSGAEISTITGITTVCDFRSTDVALGGQGAPLVPIGDHYLFGGHRFCLNLGGFANISYEHQNRRIAFDICPANIALNYLSGKKGLAYDEDGALTMQGNIIKDLLADLNDLEFYKSAAPKSLGREWFESKFLPLIENDKYSVEDRLRTVVQHIGIQVPNCLSLSPGTTMLTTGGGAYHNLLIEVIEEEVSRHGIYVVVPDKVIVDFKEAIIFAFLGVLRMRNQNNSLASVTGAFADAVGGAVYFGNINY